ncbi:MAG: hypothetical protein WC483_05680 [Candidatus Paceibacterota bacterium]
MLNGGQTDAAAAAAAAAAANGGGEAGKLTKEEVNAIVQDRLAKERARLEKEFDPIKTKAADFDKILPELNDLREEKKKRDEEQMTAEERIRKTHEKDMKAMQAELAKKDDTIKTVTQKHNEFLKKSELISAAQRLDAIDPGDVYTILRDQVQIKEDGATLYMLDEDGAEIKIEEGVKNFLDKKPNFVKNPGGPGGGARQGVDGGTLTAAMISSMTREERKKRKPEVDAFMAAQGKK